VVCQHGDDVATIHDQSNDDHNFSGRVSVENSCILPELQQPYRTDRHKR
jgi:hypothetical protein